MIILETNRLLLKEYQPGDTGILYKILSSPTTMSFWPAPFTWEQTDNWIQNNIKRYRENGFGRWSIVHKETGEIIGDSGIVIAEIDGRQENDLGYIIHHSYWQQGIALEAAQACKDYGFQTLGLKRLCANMPFNHTASRRTAEKLGMKKEKEFQNSRNRGILTYLYSVADKE